MGVFDPWVVVFKGPRIWYKTVREIVTLERMHQVRARVRVLEGWGAGGGGGRPRGRGRGPGRGRGRGREARGVSMDSEVADLFGQGMWGRLVLARSVA